MINGKIFFKINKEFDKIEFYSTEGGESYVQSYGVQFLCSPLMEVKLYSVQPRLENVWYLGIGMGMVTSGFL